MTYFAAHQIYGLFTNSEFSVSDNAIALLIACCPNKNISVSRLAKDLKMSRTSIHGSLSRMKGKVVDWTGGSGRKNKYTVCKGNWISPTFAAAKPPIHTNKEVSIKILPCSDSGQVPVQTEDRSKLTHPPTGNRGGIKALSLKSIKKESMNAAKPTPPLFPSRFNSNPTAIRPLDDKCKHYGDICALIDYHRELCGENGALTSNPPLNARGDLIVLVISALDLVGRQNVMDAILAHVTLAKQEKKYAERGLPNPFIGLQFCFLSVKVIGKPQYGELNMIRFNELILMGRSIRERQERLEKNKNSETIKKEQREVASPEAASSWVRKIINATSPCGAPIGAPEMV